MHDRPVEPQPVFPHGIGVMHAQRLDGEAPRASPGVAMRRRWRVFVGVFLVCLLAGQGANFMRDAVYVAQAKVHITPAGKPAAAPAAPEGTVVQDSKPASTVEAETLGSRPLVELAVAQLQSQGLLAGLSAEAAVFEAQRLLSVTPLPGTPLVQVRAESTDPDLAARLVNTLVEVYRDEQATSGQGASEAELTQARTELDVIAAKVAEKQGALDAYRQRSGIESTVRDENQTVARLRGLTASLTAATDREAIAAGRLRALEEAMAEGQRLPQTREHPTVANIEQRLSQQREEWRALERQFTPQFLEMDPRAKGLKTRIANLEQQLETEGLKARQSVLAGARDELARNTATVQRLQQQIASDRQTVQTFNRQLNTVQGLEGELAALGKMRQAAQDRLLTLEATTTARRPGLQVVEPAVVPDAPWRPDYWRDAGIVLAASLGLAFGAVWFVEFFNRVEAPTPGAPTLVIAQPWVAGPAPAAPAHQLRAAPFAQALAEEPEPPLLQNPLPRELAAEEVARLLDAAAPENLAVISCLLCGLTVDEVAALQLRHVELEQDLLHVADAGDRTLPLTPALRRAREQRASHGATDDSPLLLGRGGRALVAEDIAAIVTATVHDAQLDQPQSVTPASLRHTFVAFIVRQGLRFGELDRVVGRLGTDALNALAPLAPQARRVSLDAVQRVLPALLAQRPPA